MKILYLSFSNVDHSLNAVYIKGLRQQGVEVVEFFSNRSGFQKFLDVSKFYKSHRESTDWILIGYDSPGLLIWLRLMTREKIVYNALCSVYERLVISRSLVSKVSIKAVYYWLLDFFASRLASLVMLESDHQIAYFQKLFWVKKTKCFRAWTGVDEDKFFYQDGVGKTEQFTVIFRGRLLPEAGTEYVVKAAKSLEDQGIKFFIQGAGQELKKIKDLIAELKPGNLELLADFLPMERVRELMQQSHLSLGQLSDHERLQRTIPHKAYESLVLKLPYLTARNAGILELLREGETCMVCNLADADDLAKKILWAKNHSRDLVEIGNRGYELYRKELRPQILAGKLLERLKTIA